MQVTDNEGVTNVSKDVENTNDEPHHGTWMKWGNGYFYTNNKYMVMDQLNAKQSDNINIKSDDTTILNSSSETTEEHDPSITTKKYSNHCITDSYGDRYYDIPIYLLHQIDDDVNDYFQVEARKLSFKKRLRLVRLKSDFGSFEIEQILFQNKPINTNIIPILEKPLPCDEYTQVEHLENCILLFWKCIVCNVKSDHWSKLIKHNCKTDEPTAPKSQKSNENKNPALRSNGRSVPTTRSQHICPHCSGEFDSEGYLRTHLLVHINDSNKCPFCDQPVAPEMMETHLIAHKNPEFSNLKFLCKYDIHFFFIFMFYLSNY